MTRAGDEEKPNRKSLTFRSERGHSIAPIAANVVAEATGIPFAGTLAGALVDSLKERTERLRNAIHLEQEERLNKFYLQMLNGDAAMDEKVARAMVDDADFHSLVKACVADIEAEKIDAYANMARSIASGAVKKEWRRHFILALRDLAAEEIEILRRAHIAKHHNLIPVQGNSINEGHFLELDAAPGTQKAIALANLGAKGFVYGGKLAHAGDEFTNACWRQEQLTPGAIDFRNWSGHNVAIVSYELGVPAVAAFATLLQDELRKAGVKSNIIALLRDNAQHTRHLSTMAVFLCGAGTNHLQANLPYLLEFSKKVPMLLVEMSDQTPVYIEGLQVFGQVRQHDGIDREVISAICRRIIEHSNVLASKLKA
jgi:hypothetical protein